MIKMVQELLTKWSNSDFYNELSVMSVSVPLPNNMQEQLHLNAVVTLVAKV